MTTPSEQNAEPKTRTEIEADIEATRAQLGETVEALTQRLDVKARVKQKAVETKVRAVTQVRANPAIPVGVAAAVVLIVVVVVWRRRS